ncbi:MAG: anthranilate phosphoribosyltransferase [Gammaproteobacteria bacterium]
MTPRAEPADAQALMHSILQRIATGPEMSKSISEADARGGMRAVLDAQIDPVQAGIFLIALRMKRETDEETLGVLQALLDVTLTVTASVDELLVLSDPYDGCKRMLPASPFLPVLLAACGVPAITHGVETLGPKFGLTAKQVLRAAGQAVGLSVSEAAERVADPGIGWAYVDQSSYAPQLHALMELRNLIVKRSVLNTAEIAIAPIRGRRKTHLITGYVHKNYPRIYALLARAARFDSALIVKGLEGGVIPSLQKPARLFYYRGHIELDSIEVDPASLGPRLSERAMQPPHAAPTASESAVADPKSLARAAADRGMETLDGKPGPMRDALAFAAALCLWHIGRHASISDAVEEVHGVLTSGAALGRLARGVS